MKGKIGLEEHFAISETLDDSRGFFPDRIWAELKARLLDLHDNRLRLIDEYGIQMVLLSLNAPVIQAIPDPVRANDIARKANDYLAREVQKRPDRFQGPCRLADAGSRSGDPSSSTAASVILDCGAPWSMDSRRSAIRTRSSTTTCRNTGRSGRRLSSSMFRSI